MDTLKQHFKKYPLKLIIFDLDGTLVDSIHDIYAALQACCNHFNISNIPKTSIRQFVGPGAEELIKATIKGTSISLNSFYDKFREIYRHDFISQTQLFPGLKNLLNTLKTHYKLAILTNKPEDASRFLLQNLKIDHLFEKIIGPDTYNSAKPDPGGLLKLLETIPCKKESCLFIGDTSVDIYTAKNAKVPSMAITHGYGSTESLKEAKPDCILGSSDKLDYFFQSLNKTKSQL